MARLRFGLLGAARIAPVALTKPARRTGDLAEVASVAARDRARAEAFATAHGIGRVHDTYEDVLADPEVDAVYIPLPNGLHGRWTLAALAAGKHVLCEKPFTANATEAATVAEAAAAAHRASGLVVMEAFHYRHHPLADRVAAIVAGGELGSLSRVEIAFAAPLAKRGDIRYRLDLAGGALMDMGCYAVNFLRLVLSAAGLDEPKVQAARAKRSSPGVDRAMRVDYSFGGGATARTTCSMFSSSVLRLQARVCGTEGELRVFNPFSPQYFHRLTVRTRTGRRVEHVTRKATYDFQLEHFVAAVRYGGPVRTTAEDAVANMTVIDDAYRASGLGIREPSA
jgi:predicted dehydrogenase